MNFSDFALPKLYSSQLRGEKVGGGGPKTSVNVTNAISLITWESRKTSQIFREASSVEGARKI